MKTKRLWKWTPQLPSHRASENYFQSRLIATAGFAALILLAVLAVGEQPHQVGLAADTSASSTAGASVPRPRPHVEGSAYFDLPYSVTPNQDQTLDLYMPLARSATAQRPPLLVFIHGGGWYEGDKRFCTKILQFREFGYAVASINYRLTDGGRYKFPAQIYDAKAAIRWLRSHADQYGYAPERLAVWGTSAGGHLAALLGTTSDTNELAGDVGEAKASAAVQAVVDWFGPADLLGFDEAHFGNVATRAVNGLLGGLPSQHKELAKEGSPIVYASRNDPPFLIMHGQEDPLVPVAQSQKLYDTLKAAGVDATLVVVPNKAHEWFGEPYLEQVHAFLDKKLSVTK